MSASDKTWYRLCPPLTLVDESALYSADEKPYCVYDQRNCTFHFCDEDDYFLLNRLLRWRSEADLREFAQTRGELLQADVRSYLDLFLERRILDTVEGEMPTDDGACAVRFTAPGIAFLDRKQRPRGFPTSIALGITNACNLACRHCSLNSGRSEATTPITPEDASRLFDQFEKYGLWDFRITGGEPFCHPGIIDILEDVASRRFKLILFTNGTVLTKNHERVLLSLKEKKGLGFRIHLSVDGSCPEAHDWLRGKAGAFSRLCRFMEFLNESKIPWLCESILHSGNANEDSITRLAEFCFAHGCQNLMIHTAAMNGRAADLESFAEYWYVPYGPLLRLMDHADRLSVRYAGLMDVSLGNTGLVASKSIGPRKQRKVELMNLLNASSEPAKCACQQPRDSEQTPARGIISPKRSIKYCTAGVSQVYIDENGDVYPCPYFVDSRFRAGNIRSDDFLDMWASDKFLFCRGGWSEKDVSVCRGCSEREKCKIPFICRAIPMNFYGDPLAPAPECIFRYERELRPLGVRISDERDLAPYLIRESS